MEKKSATRPAEPNDEPYATPVRPFVIAESPNKPASFNAFSAEYTAKTDTGPIVRKTLRLKWSGIEK